MKTIKLNSTFFLYTIIFLLSSHIIFSQDTKSKKDKNVTVNSTTSMNGMVAIASSDPMKFVNNGYVVKTEIYLVSSKLNEYKDGIKCLSDNSGICSFENVPQGKYRIYCKLPGKIEEWSKQAQLINSTIHVNFIIDNGLKSPITFGSKTGKNPLLFESPDFILEGKINSVKVTIVTSVNNYGINDD